MADWPDVVVDIPGQAGIGADQAGIAFDRVEDTRFQDQLIK